MKFKKELKTFSGSGVLGASGVCSFHAARTIRLSIGRSSTIEEMNDIVSDLQQAVSKLL